MATSFHKVNNNAASVLASAIDDNDLALSVSSGDGAEFDSVLQYLTIGRDETYAGEVVEASSRSTDAFTLAARGQDGTAATSHDAGARVECLLVAAHITEIQDAINAIENGTMFHALIKLGDDTGFLKFGTDLDIQFVYDEATNDRLNIVDPSGNVLGYIKDLGTTGLFGVTGRLEAPQIGIAADTDLLTLTANALALAGVLTGTLDDAGTNNVATLLALYHTSTGTPASGLGAKIVLGAEDSAGNTQDAIEMHGYLTTVTSASEVGAWRLRIINAGSLIDVLAAAPASLTLSAVSNACKIFAGSAVMKQTSASQAQFGYDGSAASYGVLIVNNSTGAGNPSIGFDFFGAAPSTQNVNLFRSSTAISGDSFFTAYVPGSATVSFQVNAKQGTTATRQGAATDLVLCGGAAYVNTTAVGNVGSGEDDLMSYSVPASTLGTNNNSLYFEMHFTTAANANNKTIKVKFGGTTIWDSTAVAANNQRVVVRGRIYRTGAATQIAVASVVASGTFTNTCVTASPTETLSGAITLKATGEATSDNDVQQLAMFVGWDAANT